MPPPKKPVADPKKMKFPPEHYRYYFSSDSSLKKDFIDSTGNHGKEVSYFKCQNATLQNTQKRCYFRKKVYKKDGYTLYFGEHNHNPPSEIPIDDSFSNNTSNSRRQYIRKEVSVADIEPKKRKAQTPREDFIEDEIQSQGIIQRSLPQKRKEEEYEKIQKFLSPSGSVTLTALSNLDYGNFFLKLQEHKHDPDYDIRVTQKELKTSQEFVMDQFVDLGNEIY